MSPPKVTNRLRTLREADPFENQKTLGNALGVSRQTIIAIETGRYAPSLELALRIVQHFGLRIEEIFALPEDPS